MVAAASVTWMIVHMWRTGRRMKGDIEGRLQLSSVTPGTAAFTGVFLFTRADGEPRRDGDARCC